MFEPFGNESLSAPSVASTWLLGVIWLLTLLSYVVATVFNFDADAFIFWAMVSAYVGCFKRPSFPRIV